MGLGTPGLAAAAFAGAGFAGAAGFWIEVGGGTALYAPTKTKEKIAIL